MDRSLIPTKNKERRWKNIGSFASADRQLRNPFLTNSKIPFPRSKPNLHFSWSDSKKSVLKEKDRIFRELKIVVPFIETTQKKTDISTEKQNGEMKIKTLKTKTEK